MGRLYEKMEDSTTTTAPAGEPALPSGVAIDGIFKVDIDAVNSIIETYVLMSLDR